MFSQTVEYALRAIVFLASRRGEPATTKQIATATKVPEGYAAKVLQNLSRAGLVRSQRGLHGGSVLGVPADALTVWDVVDAVDPIRRIRTCPLGLPSHGTNLCPLHKRVDQALELVEKAFRSSTIAELLAEPTTSVPLVDLLESSEGLRAAREAAFPSGERPATLTVKRRKTYNVQRKM